MSRPIPFLEQMKLVQALAAQREDYDSAKIVKEARHRLEAMMAYVDKSRVVDEERVRALLADEEALLARLEEETDEEMLTRIVAAYLAPEKRGEDDAS